MYIANMTRRIWCENEKDSFEIYQRLRSSNKAPFSAYMNFKDFQIISSSPERFLSITDGLVQTRPIKGTRPRGKNYEEDEILREHIGNFDIQDRVLKITLTPLNIIITEKKINYKEDDYTRGMRLTISKVRRNSTSKLCYIKSTCYIENLLEKENAKKSGYDDVIFLNEKEYVTETSCANIFIVKNKNIITPKIGDGLLGGIIRSEIVKRFNVIEKSITIYMVNHIYSSEYAPKMPVRGLWI